ncbi:hypothetical protein [Streptomyces sp. NPDC091268]|uniref:hypothetical protein n=1 Tax=Streptomyces sp. NPDC091268 TaxID=3365979 RepID=UPI0038178125
MSESCTPACHQAGAPTATLTSVHHHFAGARAAALASARSAGRSVEVLQDAMPDDDIGWPR